MSLYLLLITWTIVNAEVLPNTYCDGVFIDGHYVEETLKTGLIYPSNLAVDYNTNVLYFSHLNPIFQSSLFDLNTKEFKDINDVPHGTTQTVDQNTHDVYIGGDNGIYKYDHKNHKSQLYVADKYPYSVFFKDVLYYSNFLSAFMYIYVEGERWRFEDLIDTTAREFVIDGDDIIFYSNLTGFYAQKRGGKDAVLYSEEYFIMALTIDVHGNAYMCTEKAIYKINKMRMSLDKLMDVKHCYGLAFDGKNNIIYSDSESLVRLVNIPKKC